jgi:RNA polymerase sigma-70 factor (ECF subfamily)
LTPSTTETIEEQAQEFSRWLARIALGDRDAFEALYRKTSASVFGVVLRINTDRGEAEEVLQEVYVNVWRAAGSFDMARSQPMTWLMGVARNRAIDSLRRRKAEPATTSRFQFAGDDPDDEQDILQAMPSQEPGPMELLSQASEAAHLEQCMQALSREQRASIALAYYQGLSHQEVARSLRQPLGSVKSWVRRGLLSLRGCLDQVMGLAGVSRNLEGQ